MIKKLFFPLAVCIILFSGCVANSVFEKSITIQAPKEIVFPIITDYENYETLLPMLHDSVTIVSEEKIEKDDYSIGCVRCDRNPTKKR